ncbi:MAG: hypothetical protein JSS32_02950 [Verrucomicrobia bacterium]|nr:hypothetical protein [Verrucomicrobiota bacterium]
MNQIGHESFDPLIQQYRALNQNGYMRRKIDAAIALAPKTHHLEVIHQVFRETQTQLNQFIFYLSPEEWESSEIRNNLPTRILNFRGRTPDPSKFNLCELDNMARLISMKIQASFDRVARIRDVDKVVDWDDAPTARAWRNSTLATIKTLCRENKFTLVASSHFAWACVLNDPEMQEICKPESIEEERWMIGNLKRSGQAYERIDIVAQYITSIQIAGRIFAEFLGNVLLFHKLYACLQEKSFFRNGNLGKIIFEMIKDFKQTGSAEYAHLKKAVAYMINSSRDDELIRKDLEEADEFCTEHPNLKEIGDLIYAKLGQYEF